MNTTAMWVILFRWMHLLAACIAVGGAIVMRFVLPAGLKKLEGEQREVVFLACRRAFKMFVHPTVLLILISGTYNSIHNWHAYTRDPALLHSLWGTHVLFALIAITIALWVLAGKKPPAWHRTAMAFNVLLLLLVIAAASTLKWAREASPEPTPQANSTTP